MSRHVLKAEFSMRSFTKKLKKLAKAYGENQEQAVKRWGVSTCRSLAIKTQPFGKSAKKQKDAMTGDAYKVLFTHSGSVSVSKTYNSVGYTSTYNNTKSSVPYSRYLESPQEVIKWIDNHRTAANKRTIKLPPRERAVCSEAVFKRALLMKFKRSAGAAKEGWLDAGDDISRRQKGNHKNKIGKGFLKWTRKPQKNGEAKEKRRNFKNSAFLMSHVPYTKTKYVLKQSDKNDAITDGLKNAVKWYKMATRNENKKRK